MNIAGEPLRAILCGHRGRVSVDLRWWYQPKDGSRIKPGRRGVSVPASALPAIVCALQGLVRQMEADGYLESGRDAHSPTVHPEVYPREF